MKDRKGPPEAQASAKSKGLGRTGAEESFPRLWVPQVQALPIILSLSSLPRCSQERDRGWQNTEKIPTLIWN